MDEQSKVVYRGVIISERRPEPSLRVQALSEHPPVQYLAYHQDSGLLPHKDLATKLDLASLKNNPFCLNYSEYSVYDLID